MVFSSAWFDHQTPAIASRFYVRQSDKAEFFEQTHTTPTEIRTRSNRDLKYTPGQVPALQKALSQMPPSAPKPTLDNLLIVSFWHNQTWTTRIYDRSNLPPQIVKIHQILGIKVFD